MIKPEKSAGYKFLLRPHDSICWLLLFPNQ